MKSFKNKNHEVAYNMMEISVELIDEVFNKGQVRVNNGSFGSIRR